MPFPLSGREGERGESPTATLEEDRGVKGEWESLFSFEPLFYMGDNTTALTRCQEDLEQDFYSVKNIPIFGYTTVWAPAIG